MSQYLDNTALVEALIQYKIQFNKARSLKLEPPQISNYIGDCILKIATGLSYRPEFINYTYKDDMILDGIENCILYMNNFDPTIISMGITSLVVCSEGEPIISESGATATIIKIRDKPNYGVSLLVKDTVGTFQVGEGIVGNEFATKITSLKCSNPYGYFTQIIYYAFVRRIKKEKKQQHIKNAMLQNMTFDLYELQEHDDDGHYQNSHVEYLQNIHQLDLPDLHVRKKKTDNRSTLDDFIEESLEEI